MAALVIMMYLFISQLIMFWQVQVVTGSILPALACCSNDGCPLLVDIVMDNSSGSQATMGIDFDLTLSRLPCQYASVDIFDILVSTPGRTHNSDKSESEQSLQRQIS